MTSRHSVKTYCNMALKFLMSDKNECIIVVLRTVQGDLTSDVSQRKKCHNFPAGKLSLNVSSWLS